MDSLKIENFYFLTFLCFLKNWKKSFFEKIDSLKNWKNSQKVKILKKINFCVFYFFYSLKIWKNSIIKKIDSLKNVKWYICKLV